MTDIKLQLSSIFPYLSDGNINKLLAICTHKFVKNRATILSEGTLKKTGVLILKGSIRGYIIDNKGLEQNTMLRSTGIFVGDVDALFNNKVQKLNIEAIEDTHILVFNFLEFETLVKQNSALLELYLAVLKEAILKFNYRLNSMITMTPEERYKDLVKTDPLFLKSAYSKYVANYLGITPVSLSRIIKRIQSA